jgi:hypothetical protein
MIMLVCASFAYSQRSYTSGIKAGANLYTLKVKGQQDVSTSMRTNFHAGIFYNVPLGGIFSLQPELLFSAEGADFESSTAKTETKLNYFSIPVMIQLNTKARFFVETGPALGIMVRGRETVTTSAAESKLDLKKQIKKTNFQWGGGLGYKMKKVGIYARYYFGISDLAKEGLRAETKSNGVQVGLSWSFPQ